MSSQPATAETHAPELQETIASACAAIAPLWPLDQFIAVNPFHGWSATPFRETAGKLRQLGGASLLMPPSYYREAWDKGLIRTGHLESAIGELGAGLRPEECLQELGSDRHDSGPRPLLSGILDAQRDLDHEPAWSDVITRQISRFCAAWFDESASDWQPHKRSGLYSDWKAAIRHEHGITLLMHDNRVLKRSQRLPSDPRVLIGGILDELGLGDDAGLDLLRAALLRINGWASWCAYLRWQARLQGEDDPVMEELLAIRLAWERLLDDGTREPSSPWQLWRKAWTATGPERSRTPALHVWQRALEVAYQSRIGDALCARKPSNRPRSPTAQMAFCIDVRSEIIRRAIETRDRGIQTLGFAGFFGLPIAYRPLGNRLARPQLPGLFKARYQVTDSAGDASGDQYRAKKIKARLSRRAQAAPFRKMPASAFTLVEALGLGYVANMLASALPRAAPGRGKRADGLRPAFSRPLSLEQKADLVAGILEAMSLTSDFADLVVLVGHGSKSANNPHAAGLDCGACGGQTGEVNVRLLAGLLNEPGLRRILGERGLHIPDATHFLPALHNTTTDEVVILDTREIPESHAARATALQRSLDDASELARAERARSLGLGDLAGRPARLLKAMRKRTLDWSQTRPEWGLANNAAFVVAPRARTRDVDLEGRVFLHEYDPLQDKDGAILESIMTGPMIVATWINMQYYASTVDNRHFGSGNKVLHNVAGGNIGVFEGNGGDLRTGLPMQSVHDGRQWMHTPQRLSIYLEADARCIEQVLDKHRLVRDLADNDWVFLFRIDRQSNTVQRYSKGTWSITNRPTH